MKRSINLAGVRTNYQLIQAQCPDSQIAGVVKANGYGLGVKQIVETLQKAGCHCFFVASLREALELRLGLENQQDIYVLNGPVETDITPYIDHNLMPVLNSLEQVKRWVGETKASFRPAALHVDTGMNRLGLSFDEFKTLIGSKFVEQIDWQLLMSHLSCADLPDAPLNRLQLAKFQKIRDMAPPPLRKCPASLANSAGAFLEKEYHFDLIRPGIALYGGQPTTGITRPIHPVLHVEAPIVCLRTIDQGDPVSYGASFMADKPMTIATIAIGYADGLNRHLSSTGFVDIEGKRCAILGRVTMDLIMVDVSDVELSALQVGAFVQILGKKISASEMASWAGTIDYEILTGLSQLRGPTHFII